MELTKTTGTGCVSAQAGYLLTIGHVLLLQLRLLAGSESTRGLTLLGAPVHVYEIIL